MEEWQQQLVEEAMERTERAQERTMVNAEKTCQKLMETYKIKKQIILALREEPNSIFGETSVYIKTKNHELVHDVSKTLRIKLKRTAQADGFNFIAKIGDISICVYGMQEVPHCKIVAHKVMQEVIEYEAVCNEKEKEK